MANAIYKEELDDFTSCKVGNDLDADWAESEDMKGIIDDFLTASNGKLSGEAWDAVQTSLGQFSVALSQRMSLMTNLKEAIDNAIKKLQEALVPYDSIDSSKRPELEKVVKDCSTSITSLKGKIGSLSSATVYIDCPDGRDEETGKIKYVKKPVSGAVYYRNQIGELSAKVVVLEKQMKEASDMIAAIDHFEEVLTEVKAELEEAFKAVKDFGNAIDGITPAQKYYFVPEAV